MKRKTLTTMRRLRIFEKSCGKCHLCDQRIKAGEKWEAEHRIPIAMGGADDETNLFPAHLACHSIKSKTDARNLAKVNRLRIKHAGIKRPSQWNKKYLRKVSGQTVLRTP